MAQGVAPFALPHGIVAGKAAGAALSADLDDSRSPKLCGVVPRNYGCRATIEFLKGDRPGRPGSDEAYGDAA
jgi:hypothetical protein